VCPVAARQARHALAMLERVPSPLSAEPRVFFPLEDLGGDVRGALRRRARRDGSNEPVVLRVPDAVIRVRLPRDHDYVPHGEQLPLRERQVPELSLVRVELHLEALEHFAWFYRRRAPLLLLRRLGLARQGRRSQRPLESTASGESSAGPSTIDGHS